MMPVGYLMIEHRLIERMVKLIIKEHEAVKGGRNPNLCFLGAAVDFFKAYADKGHHGKEEDILFSDLAKKPMTAEHKKIMEGLLQDHVLGRKLVGQLANAHTAYGRGKKEALADIRSALKGLKELYPNHIEKEDKRFFLPVMKYLTPGEQEEMLAKFREFDRKLFHENARRLVEGFEKDYR
jgi:hemerythrin-like domain-containing protein